MQEGYNILDKIAPSSESTLIVLAWVYDSSSHHRRWFHHRLVIFIIVSPFEKRHPTLGTRHRFFSLRTRFRIIIAPTLVITTIDQLPDGGQLPFTSLHLRLLSMILVVLKTSS